MEGPNGTKKTSSSSNKKMIIIIAVCVGGFVLAAFVVGIICYKKRQGKRQKYQQNKSGSLQKRSPTLDLGI